MNNENVKDWLLLADDDVAFSISYAEVVKNVKPIISIRKECE